MSEFDEKQVRALAAKLASDPLFHPGGVFAGCGLVLVLLDASERKTFIGAATDERSMKLYRAVTTAFIGLLQSCGNDPEVDERIIGERDAVKHSGGGHVN